MTLSPKALRKLRRKKENEELAKQARFWRKKPRTELTVPARTVSGGLPTLGKRR